ncbi:MAG: O-antigen ligase family protein [Armatimonadetes bacterium]|nr:O-antigen ligase family protein [Armatimonadota bacterium]
MKKIEPSLIWISLALFLAVIAGGHLPIEPFPLEPGLGPLLGAIFTGNETPILSSALVSLLLMVGAVILVKRRQVTQIPAPTVSLPLMTLLAFLIISVLFSQIKTLALIGASQWAIYVSAFFLCVASAGRRRGPVLLLGSVFAACVLLGMLGIVEYTGIKAKDPTWRIFSTWLEPNALAGMLAIGFLLGCGLLEVVEQKLLIGAAMLPIGFALLLTQSKGGYLTLFFGLVMFGAFNLAWIRPAGRALKVTGRAALVALLVAGLGFALQKSQSRPQPVAITVSQPGFVLAQQPAPSTAFSRVGGSGHTAEQSFTFRKNLWKTCIELLKIEPTGIGMLNFGQQSSVPGIVTSTLLAHQTWLQLAVEATIFAPLALAMAVFFWVPALNKARNSDNVELAALRSAVAATVLATCANGFIESNLYSFGIGLTFFALLGVGIQLSSDASSPEFTPKPLRGGGLFGLGLATLALCYYGYVELQKDEFLYARSQRDVTSANQILGGLLSVASQDGDIHAYAASLAPDPNQRVQEMQLAARYSPQGKYFRGLGSALASQEKYTESVLAYENALRLDPNNLLALRDLMKVQIASGDEERAQSTARRLVAVEDTTYFKTRSIPELVPTETLEARSYLLGTASDAEKLKLLKEIVSGYQRYAELTVPQVKVMATQKLPFAGEDPQRASEKLLAAIGACKQLEELAAKAGDLATVEEAKKSEAEFDKLRQELISGSA